jgi:hypothetical protein
MWDKRAHACVPATLPWDRYDRSCEQQCRSADTTLRFIPSSLFPTVQCEASLCPFVQSREVCTVLYPHETLSPEAAAAVGAGADSDAAIALALTHADDGYVGSPEANEALGAIVRAQRALGAPTDAVVDVAAEGHALLETGFGSSAAAGADARVSVGVGAQSQLSAATQLSLTSSARLSLLQARSSAFLLQIAGVSQQILTAVFGTTRLADCDRFAYTHTGVKLAPDSFEYQLSAARACPARVQQGSFSQCTQHRAFVKEPGCAAPLDAARLHRAGIEYVNAVGARAGAAVDIPKAYACYMQATDKAQPGATATTITAAGLYALSQAAPKGTVLTHVVERRGGARSTLPRRSIKQAGDLEAGADQSHHYILVGAPGSGANPLNAHPDTHIIVDFWQGLAGGAQYLVHPVAAPQNTDPFFPATARAHAVAAGAVHPAPPVPGSAAAKALAKREGPGHTPVGVPPVDRSKRPTPSGVGAAFSRRAVASHDIHAAKILQHGKGFAFTVVGGFPSGFPMPPWVRAVDSGKPPGADPFKAAYAKAASAPGPNSGAARGLEWHARRERLRKAVYALLNPAATQAGRDRARAAAVARVKAEELERLQRDKERWTRQYAVVRARLAKFNQDSAGASLLEGISAADPSADTRTGSEAAATAADVDWRALRAEAEAAWATHVEQRSVALNEALAKHGAATKDRAQWGAWAAEASAASEGGSGSNGALPSLIAAGTDASTVPNAAPLTNVGAHTTGTEAEPAAAEKPLLSFVDMILAASSSSSSDAGAAGAEAEAAVDAAAAADAAFTDVDAEAAAEVETVLLELRSTLSHVLSASAATTADARGPLATLKQRLARSGHGGVSASAATVTPGRVTLSARALAMLARRTGEAVRRQAAADPAAAAGADLYALPPAQALAIARFLASLARPHTRSSAAAAANTGATAGANTGVKVGTSTGADADADTDVETALPGEDGADIDLERLLSEAGAAGDYEALQLGLEAVLRAQHRRARAPVYASAVYAPDFDADAGWGRLKYALWSDTDLLPALQQHAARLGSSSSSNSGVCAPASPYPHLPTHFGSFIEQPTPAQSNITLAATAVSEAAASDPEHFVVYVGGERFDLAPLFLASRPRPASLWQHLRLLTALDTARAYAQMLRPASIYASAELVAQSTSHTSADSDDESAPDAVRAVLAKTRAAKTAAADDAAAAHVLSLVGHHTSGGGGNGSGDIAHPRGRGHTRQPRVRGLGLRAALGVDDRRMASLVADARRQLAHALPGLLPEEERAPALVDVINGVVAELDETARADAAVAADAEDRAAAAARLGLSAEALSAARRARESVRRRVIALQTAGPLREALNNAAAALKGAERAGTIGKEAERAARAWLYED